MKKLNKFENNNIFTFTLLLVVAIMVLSLCFLNTDLVFAEETDTILNFNQLGKISSVSSSVGSKLNDYQMQFTTTTTTNKYVAYPNSLQVYSSHKYYTRIPSFLRIFNSASSTLFYGGERVQNAVSDGTTYGFYYHSSYGTFTTGIYNYVVIDLTLMYGSNNEPTLEQCKEIFTADYYTYNEGTPISLSQLNYNLGYENGYSDGYNSFTTQPIFTNSLYNVWNSINSSSNTIKAVINSDGSITYSNINQYYIYFNMEKEFEYGKRYNIKFDICLPSNSDELTLNFQYVIEPGGVNNELCDIEQYYNFDFTFYYGEQDATSVKFYLYSSDAAMDSLTIKNLVIYEQTDLETNYNAGYEKGLVDGRLEGAELGYDRGYNDGVSYGSQHSTDLTSSSFWSWFSTMFTNIGSLFNVELFGGITIGTLILIPLLLSILLFILKLVRGN